MIQGQKTFTSYFENEEVTITSDWGITSMSIVLVSGAGTFKGNAILPNGIESKEIDLIVGFPITTPSTGGFVDGVTITTTGKVLVLGYI